MANKAISELPQASNVNNQDLFVLEQSGIAKKLTAETFITEQGIIDALAEALDGHGGIASVTLSSISGRTRTYLITFTDGTTTTFQVLDGTTIQSIAKTSTAGLVDTYTVTMSDGTTSFFTVTNGASITSVEKTSTSGLVDTYTITLNNGTTQTFTVTNGERGPVGPAGDYAGIVGRDSLNEAAMDDEFLVYDTSDEFEKKISLAGLETSLVNKASVRTITNGENLNNITTPGFYYVTSGVSNRPSSLFNDPYGIVVVGQNASESYKVQTFFAARPGYEGIAQRLYSSSTWGNWYRIGDVHTGSNLAWVENSTTASRAYSVGDYVTINGVLCKITAAVANGGTLTSGTNYTAVGGGGGLNDFGKSYSATTKTGALWAYAAVSGVTVTVSNIHTSISGNIACVGMSLTNPSGIGAYTDFLTGFPKPSENTLGFSVATLYDQTDNQMLGYGLLYQSGDYGILKTLPAIPDGHKIRISATYSIK